MRAESIIAATLFVCSGAVLGDQTPARLRQDERSIEAQLRLPEGLPQGQYIVLCEGVIVRTGLAGKFSCYSVDPAVPETLTAAVADAGHRARFVPATRNGKRVDVYMVLSARIQITPTGPLVLVVPNNGADSARYGLLYTAPQRFNEFTWFRKVGVRRRPRDLWIWQSLSIDEHGKIVDYRLANTGDVPPGVVRSIEAHLKKMEFMPGYYEGKPVPMIFVEPAW